jgi:hypothetical protein
VYILLYPRQPGLTVRLAPSPRRKNGQHLARIHGSLALRSVASTRSHRGEYSLLVAHLYKQSSIFRYQAQLTGLFVHRACLTVSVTYRSATCTTVKLHISLGSSPLSTRIYRANTASLSRTSIPRLGTDGKPDFRTACASWLVPVPLPKSGHCLLCCWYCRCE